MGHGFAGLVAATRQLNALADVSPQTVLNPDSVMAMLPLCEC
jgi:hypothetical protein